MVSRRERFRSGGLPLPESRLTHCSSWCARYKLLEKNKGKIAGVAGLPEPPFPLFRRAKRLAGELPVEQVRLFLLVAVGFHHDIPVLASDPLNFPQCLVQVITIQVM